MLLNKPLPENYTKIPITIAILRERCRLRRLDKRLGNDNFQKEVERFISMVVDSDQIVEFSTPKSDWKNGNGSSGIALIRNGIYIAGITTRLQ